MDAERHSGGQALIDALAGQLASLRKTGAVDEVALTQLTSMSEAYAVQEAALADMEGAIVGYAVTGVNADMRHRLGLSEPVWSALIERNETPERVIPRGFIGCAPALCFVFGCNYPAGGEALDMTGLRASIASTFGAVRLYGRRVPSSVPLTSLTAAADFGLHAGLCRGPHLDAASVANVTMEIDGQRMALVHAPLVDAALTSVLWLAEDLAARGRCIEAGMTVAAEACTPIFQVSPNQRVTVAFDAVAAMTLHFR
jgi:2-keto-4-pentenoate hydratase